MQTETGSTIKTPQGERHGKTAVATSTKFLLFYVCLQVAGPVAERDSRSHEANLLRSRFDRTRPGASAAHRGDQQVLCISRL